MPTIEQQIIEAGYKDLLKRNHPDRAKTETDRAFREEFCKSLAVARDKLTALATQSASVPHQPNPASQTARTPSPPRPITRDEVAQFLMDLSRVFLGIPHPAQQRRTRRSRR